MEYLEKAICAAGLLMTMVGACAMDSASLKLPISFCLIGMALVAMTYKAYKL